MEDDGAGRSAGYKSLTAYQKAYELAFRTYRATQRFPAEEMYGLTTQIRRAAVSIPSNISEGYRRCSRNDYIKFLRIAYGSCAEFQTQISLSHDLEFINETDYQALFQLGEQVSRLLWRLIQSLKYTTTIPNHVPSGRRKGPPY